MLYAICYTLYTITILRRALQNFVLFALDIITDTIAWSTFLTKGHHLFGGVLALTSWWSTLTQRRHGLWSGMVDTFNKVYTKGVMTEEFIELFDSEKGLETLFAFTVQVYAYWYVAQRRLSARWEMIERSRSCARERAVCVLVFEETRFPRTRR